MRKNITISLLVVFCMFSLLPQVAVANQAITVQKATEIAKSIVTIPEEIKDFKSNYSEYNNRGTWQLNWTMEDGDISVYVDALSGEVIHYHKYQSLPNNDSKIYGIEREKAIKIANSFLAKAIPSKYDNLKILETDNYEINKYEHSYNFIYHRIVSDIPFLQNSAYITVSARTGEITSYDLHWDYNLEFASKTGIIGLEKATQKLKENAFQLMYHKTYSNNKPKVYLVYGLKPPANDLINAHTGEYTESDYRERRIALDKEMAMGAGEAINQVKLNPKELEEIEVMAGLLTKEEAINNIKKYIEIPSNYKLNQSYLYQDYNDKNKRTWSIDWQLNEENNYGYISAVIDAKNKEILSFNISENIPDRHLAKPNYKPEEALKLAGELITKIQPSKFKQVKLNENKYQDYIKATNIKLPEVPYDNMITLEYNRYVNNIPFYDDSISVTVDLVTGKIISYQCNWSNLSFPSPSNIVSLDTAFNNLLKENKINLEYIQTYNYYRWESSNNKKISLYYHFSKNEPKLVDAFTGKLLTYNGQEFKKQKPDLLTDIENHPAQKDIKTLFDLGIVSGEEGKFFPDNNITNAEFIKMLVLASSFYPGEGRKIESLGDEWYAPYYQTAIYRKIIDKDNLPRPEGELARIQASYMLAKAMNIDFVANLSDIYLVPTEDAETINLKDKGYVAITTKLGLFKLKAGNFEADEIMTKGETATTFVQYMRINKK